MAETYSFLKKGDELAADISKKVKTFQQYVERHGHLSSWRKNRAFYENRQFGNMPSVDVLDAGSAGEIKATTFNHFRNILRHMLNALTQNVPVYDVSAINTDVQSRRSCKIGRHLVDYYHKVKRLAKYMYKVAELALVDGDGYLVAEWNPVLGKKTSVGETGEVMHEGDFDFGVVSAFDVFYDHTKQSKDEWQWVTFRRRKNKFDLAKVHPKKAKEILALDPYHSCDPYSRGRDNENEYDSESPDVWVYSTYHKASNVLPNGKYILSVGDDETAITLYEGDNLYRDKLPIFALSPAEYIETSIGFTEANVLRSPQMVVSLCISYMLTNLEAFKTNNIWSADPNTSVETIADGMNLIKATAKPEVISFYQENPSLLNMLQLAINTMETLSGQNAVVRGNVKDTPNLKSGVALATVITQANQYSQGLEHAYHEMFEDVYSFILDVLKKIPKTERIYEIAGVKARTAVASFKSGDLKGISRVVVDRTNPISKTPSGQVEIAMELLKIGKITPEKFFDVINTGRLENAVESDERLLDYIAAVKERLLDGQPVQPIPGVNHQLLIGEVQSLLYDLDLVNNPDNRQIVQNITTLIQGHMKLVSDGDQIAALIYGGQPPMPNSVSPEEVRRMGQGGPGLPPGVPPDPSSTQMAGPTNPPQGDFR